MFLKHAGRFLANRVSNRININSLQGSNNGLYVQKCFITEKIITHSQLKREKNRKKHARKILPKKKIAVTLEKDLNDKSKGQSIMVSPGYFRNYLQTQNIARYATHQEESALITSMKGLISKKKLNATGWKEKIDSTAVFILHHEGQEMDRYKLSLKVNRATRLDINPLAFEYDSNEPLNLAYGYHEVKVRTDLNDEIGAAAVLRIGLFKNLEQFREAKPDLFDREFIINRFNDPSTINKQQTKRRAKRDKLKKQLNNLDAADDEEGQILVQDESDKTI